MATIQVNNLHKDYKVHKQSTGFKNMMKNFFKPEVEIVKAVDGKSFQINPGGKDWLY